ncbi:MAG: nucleotidyltransferase family protein [Alphaproteobacteria bacterium]|nr:nucleotidyltransferase family protein [Alphaproteobacteria bacterium]
MVLAAGKGTRMRDLASERPKPLIKVKDTPLIDGVLDRVSAAGIRKVVVNVHHFAGMLRDHLVSRQEPEIAISDESDQLLDTGGGVARALEHFDGRPFFVLNADVLWLDGRANTLSRLAQRWSDEEMDALLLMCFTVNAIGYEGLGDFMMADDGRLSRREEQCVAPFAYSGIQVLHPRLFDAVPGGVFSLNRLWDKAESEGRLFGLIHEGAWMHVGTPEGVSAAEDVLSSL